MRARLVVSIVICGLIIWFFGRALFSEQSFVFRDAAHYYYPLFEWIDREWSAGRIPLWNPQDNCGVPVVADGTSSVFYPGKLIFALPFNFTLRYKMYITSHVLLAAFGAYCLARRHGASTMAAGACAISYAFGGIVLFQYCNVVFLVGAAWLPFAMLCVEQMFCRQSVAWSVAFGIVLSLMIFGGDPQAAYHAALLAALYAAMLWLAKRRERRRQPSGGTDEGVRLLGWSRRLSTSRLVLLAFAAISGALLAAVQILPSVEWTQQSDRAAYTAPRSVYEIPTFFVRNSSADVEGPSFSRVQTGLFGEPELNTHHAQLYQFSVGPWRVAELVWPNFSGRTFPTHRRWTAVIPAEGRIWTPTLYMGLLPLLFGIGSFRLRGGTVRQRWLSWLLLLAAVGSLGWYGLGWAVHEIRCGMLGAQTDDVVVGQPVGGLYWLMVVLLPGYVQFRYPAKLLVIAALALSLLAARGWDAVCQSKSRVVSTALAIFAVISFFAALVALCLRPLWSRLMSGAEADDYFGPLDVNGSANDLFIALIHTALLSSLLFVIFRFRRQIGVADGKRLSLILLLITAVDLALANGWLVATAPQQIWNEPPALAEKIESIDKRQPPDSGYRVYRSIWMPREWRLHSSPQRQIDGLQWDHDTLFPKYHLQTDLRLDEAPSTLTSQDFESFMQVARQYGPQREDGQLEPHPDVLSALSTRYLMLPSDVTYADGIAICPSEDEKRPAREVILWVHRPCFPRAWIVHDVETLPAIKSYDPASIRRRTERVLFPNGSPRDLRHSAVVETNLPLSLPDENPNIAEIEGPRCEILVDQPQRVEIEASLARPGLLVLNDLYYPGWRAEVISHGRTAPDDHPVLRTNRIMRGIYLPAGEHRVVFRYRPLSFNIGALVSGLAWSCLLLTCFVALLRNQRSRFLRRRKRC